MTITSERRTPPSISSDLSPEAVRDISDSLNLLLADIFVLYVKTKNFHWHMSGRHFRDYHLMLDEQADQIFGMIDAIAERCRKLGRRTITSIGQIHRQRRLLDNDANHVTPEDMLVALHDDNLRLAGFLRDSHELCEEHLDIATASLLENWLDEAEGRAWYLHETSRG